MFVSSAVRESQNVGTHQASIHQRPRDEQARSVHRRGCESAASRVEAPTAATAWTSLEASAEGEAGRKGPRVVCSRGVDCPERVHAQHRKQTVLQRVLQRVLQTVFMGGRGRGRGRGCRGGRGVLFGVIDASWN